MMERDHIFWPQFPVKLKRQLNVVENGSCDKGLFTVRQIVLEIIVEFTC